MTFKKYIPRTFAVQILPFDEANCNGTISFDQKDNNYDLSFLSLDEAIVLIRKRIGDLQFLRDAIIIKIFKKNKNPRAFLKNCEEICRNAFELGAEKVTDKHVSEFAIN
jgi:hypothetical protein